MCVTVVIVAVCSIATVRWWLLLFCLSNIEIVFKSLMMLYYYFFRVNNEKVPWLQVSEAGFLCLWFVWVLILICCLLGWFRGICWCVSECPFSFKLVGPRNISLHLIHKLFNISYCVVGVGLRGGMVCIQRCDDFGGIGGFLVVGHLCDFVICYS